MSGDGEWGTWQVTRQCDQPSVGTLRWGTGRAPPRLRVCSRAQMSRIYRHELYDEDGMVWAEGIGKADAKQ